MADRTPRAANFIKEEGAKFFSRERNKTSLITVTGSSVSPDLKKATLFITVMPEEKEEETLLFAKRKRTEFRETLKKIMRTKAIPFVDIAIDEGEKNRQKIDELLKNG